MYVRPKYCIYLSNMLSILVLRLTLGVWYSFKGEDLNFVPSPPSSFFKFLIIVSYLVCLLLTDFLSDQGLIGGSGPTAKSVTGQNQGNVYLNCCQCLYLYVASVYIQVDGI